MAFGNYGKWSEIDDGAYLLNFRCSGPKKLNVSRSHDLFVLLQSLLRVLLFRKQNESVTFRKKYENIYKNI